MNEEIFDVVNERDEVVGCAPRSVVHRDGLLHRAVHILVFNSRGEVFLQKRSLSKDTFPGVWDSSSSGHLSCGEDYDAATIRELDEEIGLKVASAPERLFRVEACEATGQEFVWTYRLRSDEKMTLNREEISEGGWFSQEYVTRWVEEKPSDFARAFVLIWREFTRRGV
jgi:isopentenyl-diphosphate delta-isomerase